MASLPLDDVYIKEGNILRGAKARKEIARRDMNDVLRDAGIASHLSEADESDDTSNEPTLPPLGQPCVKDDPPEQDSEAAGFSVKTAWVHAEVKTEVERTAKAIKKKIKKVSITGVNAELEATANSKAIRLKLQAGNADVSALKVAGTAEASAIAHGAALKLATADVALARAEGTAEALIKVQGVDLKVATGQLTGVKAGAHIKAAATAQGASVNTLAASATGVNVQAGLEASAIAQGVNVKAATRDYTGAKAEIKAEATASMKGANIKAGTTQITGFEASAKATAEAEMTGADISVANMRKVATKIEASACVRSEVKGTEIKAANVNITGNSMSAKAEAKLSTAGFEANIGNVGVAGGVEAGVQASAELKPGIDAFNVDVGPKSGGIGGSKKFQFGNVALNWGLPSLHFGPHLNLGFGGGGSSGGSTRGGNRGSSTSQTGGNRNSGGASKEGEPGNPGDVGAHACSPSTREYDPGTIYTSGFSTEGGSSLGPQFNSGFGDGRSSGGYTRGGNRRSTASRTGGNRSSGGDIGVHTCSTSMREYVPGTISTDGFSTEGGTSDDTIIHGEMNAHEAVGRSDFITTRSAVDSQDKPDSTERVFTDDWDDRSEKDFSHRYHGSSLHQKSTAPRSSKLHSDSVGGSGDTYPGHSKVSGTVGEFSFPGDGLRRRHVKRKPDLPQDGHEQSYGELLSSEVQREIAHLRRTPRKCDKQPSDVRIPKSREEAKRWLTDRLRPVGEELAKSRAETKETSSANASSKETPSVESTSDSSKTSTTDECRPNKKPFGASKNIHTLECFRSESTRELRRHTGNGKIVGFKD